MQKVDFDYKYPSTVSLKASGGVGIDDIINRLNKQVKACPEQLFSLVGYSQGAGVVHGIFEYENRTYPGAVGSRPTLDQASTLSKISTMVTFGDPGFRGDYKLVYRIPSELQSKLKINCSHGDPVSTSSNYFMTCRILICLKELRFGEGKLLKSSEVSK
jgi:cutinase